MNPTAADPNPAPTAKTAPGFDPEPFRASLTAFLQRRGAREETADLVQETFLRSLRQPPSGQVKPWLFRIAGNLLTDQRRSQRRAYVAMSDLRAAHDPETASDGERISSDREALGHAIKLVSELPNRQRRALELRLLESLDYDEVGARIGCSGATARQHFYLAMKALRAALASPEDQHEPR